MKLHAIFGKNILVVFSILALVNHSALAHQSVGDDDFDDSTVDLGSQKRESIGLEPIKKIEKSFEKFEVWHSFAGDEKKKRGHLIVYRNNKT